MVSGILFFLLEVAIQTLFLTLGLWVLIRYQRLECHFPGLLGSAALVSLVERILDVVLGHFLGIYLACSISTPIVVAMLYLCLKKVTQADRTDIYFTVGVGYALVFGMNLWLLGMLMGNLRPADSDFYGTNALASAGMPAPAQSAPSNHPPVAAAHALPAANPAPSLAGQFRISGITRNAGKSSVTLRAFGKSYTLALGEAVTVKGDKGPMAVGLKELGDTNATLIINDVETKIPLR